MLKILVPPGKVMVDSLTYGTAEVGLLNVKMLLPPALGKPSPGNSILLIG